MLTRKIEKEITNWINNDRRALLIDGARQVGKTYSIRKCLQQSNRDFVEVNLIENNDARLALSKSDSVQDLIINLSAATGHSFIENQTIVFIDEVQEERDVVTKVKFWVDDGRFKFVLSGSLLGIELKALRSAPVGYVTEKTMYPLDFEEFITASGVTEEVIAHLKECFDNKKPLGELIHKKMMQLFNRYLVVGGMPDAVQEFVSTGNISTVGSIQRDIMQYYKRDFTKYEKDDKKLLLTSIYDLIPGQLLKQNRRFNYADIKKGLRFDKLENSFLWLYKAGVVLPSFNVTEPKIALKLNEKSSLVKLYYSDVGLLTQACDDALRKEILFGDGNANLGGIYENAVIQQMTAHGFDVYYYNSKKLGELDFVVEYGGKVVPIEVKSGKDYYVHSAISNVTYNSEFDIEEAFVFTGYDLTTDGKITYYPIYMSTFLSTHVDLPILEPIEIKPTDWA